MAQARVIKLQRILRKYTLQFQSLFSILTCSHILLCQPKLNDPHSLKVKVPFTNWLSNYRPNYTLSDIQYPNKYQSNFLILPGARTVKRPIIIANPINVTIHTVVASIELLDDVLSLLESSTSTLTD